VTKIKVDGEDIKTIADADTVLKDLPTTGPYDISMKLGNTHHHYTHGYGRDLVAEFASDVRSYDLVFCLKVRLTDHPATTGTSKDFCQVISYPPREGDDFVTKERLVQLCNGMVAALEERKEEFRRMGAIVQRRLDAGNGRANE
jgi:hypothetical protein